MENTTAIINLTSAIILLIAAGIEIFNRFKKDKQTISNELYNITTHQTNISSDIPKPSVFKILWERKILLLGLTLDLLAIVFIMFIVKELNILSIALLLISMFIFITYIVGLFRIRKNIMIDETILATEIYLYSLSSRANVFSQGLLKVTDNSNKLYDIIKDFLDETYYNILEFRNLLLNQSTELQKKLLDPKFNKFTVMYNDTDKWFTLIKNSEQSIILKDQQSRKD